MATSFPIVIETSKVVSSESLPIPTELDGSKGYWRGSMEDNLIRVDNDRDAVLKWIETKQDSPQTQRAYRKEGERLLLWCLMILGKPLSSLNPEDFDAYKEFLENPPADWISARDASTGNITRYRRSNPKWRPFSEKLSDKSQRQALIIIKGMLVFLQNSGYLRKNVLAPGLSAAANFTKKKKRSKEQSESPKTISIAEWNTILRYIDNLAYDKSEQGQFEFERAKWLAILMKETGRRIEEIASHTMGDFREKEMENYDLTWWLEIEGKGDVYTPVPVNNRLLKALRNFRIFLGLTALPRPNEKTPLVPSKRYKKLDPSKQDFPTYSKGVGSRQLYRILMGIFEGTANSLSAEEQDVKDRMLGFYPHMIRHTAITEYGRHADLRLQQEFAGHSDPKTTMIYNQSLKTELMDAAQKMGGGSNDDES